MTEQELTAVRSRGSLTPDAPLSGAPLVGAPLLDSSVFGVPVPVPAAGTAGRARAATVRHLVVTTVAVLVVAAGWAAGTGHLDGVAVAGTRLQHVLAARGSDAPTAGFESASAPLGSPPPAVPSDRYLLQAALPAPPDGGFVDGGLGVSGAGSSGRMAEQSVLAYDPCRPVHYVVRTAGAPPGGDRVLAEAIGRVSAATGLVFVADGPTDERPVDDRRLFQPEVYGDRWAPVLISWATAEEVPALAGDVAGLGGSASVALPGSPQVLVTGVVTLDGPQLGELLRGPGGEALVRSVVMHELGHLVGLEHLDDPTQLMNPTTSPGLTEFAAGDLAGLARLGRGPCVPQV